MYDFVEVATGVLCLISIIGVTVFILHVSHTEGNYQQKALNNGLAATVVEMKQTGKYSAKSIANILDIKTEDVYDILETEEEN